MARRMFVCGNWKMNTTPKEGERLAQDVLRLTSRFRDVDIAVGPPSTHLDRITRKLEGSNVGVAAQNVHFESEGAFTGEVSVPMLAELGCTYVILGHSERRAIFGETDALVGKKVVAALAGGLQPILCVGESLEERERGATIEVVVRQLRAGLDGVAGEDLPKVTVAYEPVWAIGTGRTATPEQAQEVHAKLRRVLTDVGGAEAADAMRIQYGGSVKPGNAAEIFAQPDVDGGLIGGASLDPESFAAIVQAAKES